MPAPRPPRAFGTGDPQRRDRLLGAQLRSVARPSRLDVAIETIEGVGPATARTAAKLGLRTVGDLLEHLPFDHRDYERSKTVAGLAIGEEATVAVTVRSCRVRPTRRRGLRLLECQVADDTGPMKAIWFNQDYLADQLGEGVQLLLRGKLERGRGGAAFKVREHERVGGAEAAANGGAGRHTTGLVPVYPATEGLSARRLRDLCWHVRGLERHALEPLAARLRARERLPDRAAALASAHFPRSLGEVEPARRRLAFEELLLLQLGLVTRRRSRRVARPSERLPARGPLAERWLKSLGFKLTGDQQTALEEIDGDLVGGRPMQRLLMGEVGSGKTVVALYAMLRAAEAGMQAALMAPTETLAEQHYATLERLVPIDLFAADEATRLGAPIALLTGSTQARERRDVLARLAAGELKMLVGTHALIEKEVGFSRLALAVVDEQHRFGVGQRTALDRKAREGLAPHVLHLTATPIPRTLSLTLYGDLDSSTLRQLPAGRRPVRTWVVPEQKRAGAYDFIRERLREGRQCFVVCPLVEESEALQAKAAKAEADRLSGTEFRDFRVEVMHGQMPASQKREAMGRFASGEVEVLVATSVIEVGIDVANASVMVIEEADRYGISQLHQLRGRVGRGEHESYCMLFSGSRSELAARRLTAVECERDGFKLAEVDLSLRGEGDVLGTRQSGMPELRVARLPEDLRLLELAGGAAIEVIAADPELGEPEHVLLREAIVRRFGPVDAEPIAA